MFDEHIRIAFPDILGGVAPAPAASPAPSEPKPAKAEAKAVPMPTKPIVSTIDESDDDLPGFDKEEEEEKPKPPPKPTKDKATSDAEVNKLMAEYGLDDL